MPTTRRRWLSLVLGLASLAICIAVLFAIPAINNAHSTDQPVPGKIVLPPTVTPAP